MPYKDKNKQSAYQTQYVQKRRQSWIEKNGPCTICGSADDLEIDHIDPTMKTSHRIWSWADRRRGEELEKCQVLCHPCHQEKTTAYVKSITVYVHGTDWGYRRGCRCDSCREARRIYRRGVYVRTGI